MRLATSTMSSNATKSYSLGAENDIQDIANERIFPVLVETILYSMYLLRTTVWLTYLPNISTLLGAHSHSFRSTQVRMLSIVVVLPKDYHR